MGGQNSKLAINEAWRTWLDSPMRRNPTPQTIKTYEIHWNKFKDWTEKKGVEFLHEATRTSAQDFCSELWKSGLSPGSYNKYLRFLRSFFETLRDRAGISENPFDKIPCKSAEVESRRNLTIEELNSVCQTATGNMRYLFAVGLYVGCRLGDAVSMKWEYIDFERGMIEFKPSKTKRKKKVVQIPLHPVLAKLLKELKDKSDSDYLFPDEHSAYQKHTSNLTRPIQKHFEACGIKTTEKPQNSHRRLKIVRIGFHSLRHSFVSLMAAQGVPGHVISDMAGHLIESTTGIYKHSDNKQNTAGIKALPEIDFKNKVA